MAESSLSAFDRWLVFTGYSFVWAWLRLEKLGVVACPWRRCSVPFHLPAGYSCPEAALRARGDPALRNAGAPAMMRRE